MQAKYILSKNNKTNLEEYRLHTKTSAVWLLTHLKHLNLYLLQP